MRDTTREVAGAFGCAIMIAMVVLGFILVKAGQVWEMLAVLPKGTKVHDRLEVAAIIQLMLECETEEQLKELGKRINKTKLRKCDRQALRPAYVKCVRMIKELECS